MLNWGLLANPVNWLTIILMVIIGAFAIDAVVNGVNTLKARANSALNQT